MKRERPDVVELLHDEIQYHRSQIKKIKRALEALEDDSTQERIREGGGSTRPMRSIRMRTRPGWSSALKDIFEQLEEGEVLELSDLVQKLTDLGLPANTETGKATLLSTISRLIGESIDRVKPGYYIKLVDKVDLNDKVSIEVERGEVE